MTEAQAHSPFIDSLDRKTLDAINDRILKLEPLVNEYRELCRRRRILETKYGLNRTSDLILSLLEDYPKGLPLKEIARMLERESHVIRATCGDLVKSGRLVRAAPGIYAYPRGG